MSVKKKQIYNMWILVDEKLHGCSDFNKKKEYTGVKELFHFTTHMLQNKTN